MAVLLKKIVIQIHTQNKVRNHRGAEKSKREVFIAIKPVK